MRPTSWATPVRIEARTYAWRHSFLSSGEGSLGEPWQNPLPMKKAFTKSGMKREMATVEARATKPPR
jgi:hypothetical protein